MGYERSGIKLLLGLLLLLSSLIGALHATGAMAQAKQSDTQHTVPAHASIEATPTIPGYTPAPKNLELPKLPEAPKPAEFKPGPAVGGMAAVKPKEAVELMMPLVVTNSVEDVVTSMSGIPVDVALAIMREFMTDSRMTRNQFLQVLFGVALYFANKPEEQSKLFSLILSKPNWLAGEPLLFIAAMSSYPQIIKALSTWIKQQNKSVPAFSSAEYKAYQFAIDHNAPKAVEALGKNGAPLTKKRATRLLWRLASSKKDLSREMARYLIANKADPNFVKDGKHTTLMQAVRRNKLGVVEVILESKKADVKKIVVDDVGSALQLNMAMQNKESALKKTEKQAENLRQMQEIEKLLRKAGAF